MAPIRDRLTPQQLSATSNVAEQPMERVTNV